MSATDLGYQLAETRAMTKELDMLKREYELQRSVLVRPDYLAGAAKARLGMGSLSPDRVKRVR